MAVSSKAMAAEKAAFQLLQSRLHAQVFAEPAGFDTGFPDFGLRLLINGKKVDLHIEYKADSKAQMGSMRDWIFDGSKFMTADPGNEEKADLIEIMNNTPEAVKNAQRILNDFKTYADPNIKFISSGMMAIEKDKELRRSKLISFTKNTESYKIAKIIDTSLGNKIINHYKSKFKKSKKPDAYASALLFMIGNKLWLVDKTMTFNADIESAVAQKLSGATKIPSIGPLSAALEVRIQPRGLSGPGKPVSVDVMASFRLAASLSGGLTVSR